jgi:hypothetical protein
VTNLHPMTWSDVVVSFDTSQAAPNTPTNLRNLKLGIITSGGP